MMKAYQHFKTITYHKWLVMKGCFSIGLYKQGICHDLSKYSPTEFLVGARFFQGDRSPNNAEREEKGYSASWLHHKGRNKHHYEYWIDYGLGENGATMIGMEMPVKYVVEMFLDRIAASRNYQGDAYRDDSPLKYFMRGKGQYLIHEKTEALLQHLLEVLAEQGEEAALQYVKNEVLPHSDRY